MNRGLLLLLVFSLSGSDAKVARSLNTGVFSPGTEYRYEWEANVSLNPTESTNSTTSTRLRGQLNVRFQVEASESRALLSLSNVTVSVRHGSKVENKFSTVNEFSDQLSRPFQTIYTGTKVKGIAFNDDEPIWSANFKRSIASLFQVELQKGSTYDDQEMTIYGKCAVRYQIPGQSKKQIRKETNFTSCDGKFGRWGPLKTLGLQKSSAVNGSTWYSVSRSDQGVQIDEIRTTNSILHDPFEGISNSSLVSKTTAVFKLKSRSDSTVSDAPIEGNWTRFDSLTAADEAAREPTDLKMARSSVHLSGPSRKEMEYVRMKTLMDLFSMAEEVGSAERKIDPAYVSLQLSSLDYGNVAVLHTELSATVGSKKYEPASQLFWDLLMECGSSAGIVFLRDSLRTGQLDEWRAAQLVAAAAVHARHPSENLLQVFRSMMDEHVQFGDNLHLFRNAATLAFTVQLKKVCADSTDRRTCLKGWQQKFFDRFTATGSFGEKGLYVHALRNVGYGAVLDRMIQLAATIGHEDHDHYLRVYIIHGLNEYRRESQVSEVLKRLLRDKDENYQVRIAAASVLLGDPTAEQVRDVRDLLNEPDTSRDLRHFLTTWLRSIAHSQSHHLRNLKQLARELVDSLPWASSSAKYSSSWAIDFVEVSSPVGARLQVHATAGQFDDLPAFIDAKLTCSMPGFLYEPFSLTLRMTNARKYAASLLDMTLRQQEFHLHQLRQVAEALRMAARKERRLSFDLGLAAHGATLLFYHVDQRLSTDRTLLLPWRHLEKTLDVSIGHQSWLSLGRFEQLVPNGLGLPIRRMFDLRLETRLRAAVRKPLASFTTFTGVVDSLFYGQLRAEHGLMMEAAALGVFMGAMRQSQVSVDLPLSIQLSTEIKSLKEFHFDLRYRLPTENNSLQIDYSSRTVLKFHASQSGRQLCPGCPSSVAVRDPSAPDAAKTIFDWSSVGVEAVAQVSDCDVGSVMETAGQLVQKLAQAVVSRETSVAFAVPRCGFRFRMSQSSQSPVTEIVSHLKVRADWNDAMERALRHGKTTVKGHVTFKDQTSRDRTGEIDLVHEFKWTKSQVNAFIRLPLNDRSHWLICLRSEVGWWPTGRIWDADRPPGVHFGVDWAMGSSTRRNQCPRNQLRLKVNLKASTGDWVMQRRDEASTWPYRQCQMQRADWKSVTPETEACYRSAVDFTSLSNYNVDIVCAGITGLLSTMNYSTDVLQTSFSQLVSVDSAPPSLSSNGAERLVLNASFRPERDQLGERVLDLNLTALSRTQQWQIPIPSQLSVPLPSLAASVEREVLPSCVVTSQYVQSLDNVTWSNQFTGCYSLISSDCGTTPSFAVFARKANGSFPLAVKVNIGADVIEMGVGDGGRANVRVNGRDIDVRRAPFTVPEGRLRFFAIKISFQSPNVVVWSPVADLSIEFSGVHAVVRPSWLQRNHHCGLCGNFDGEPANDWTDPRGCPLVDPSHVIASYTADRSCFSNLAPVTICPQN